MVSVHFFIIFLKDNLEFIYSQFLSEILKDYKIVNKKTLVQLQIYFFFVQNFQKKCSGGLESGKRHGKPLQLPWDEFSCDPDLEPRGNEAKKRQVCMK